MISLLIVLLIVRHKRERKNLDKNDENWIENIILIFTNFGEYAILFQMTAMVIYLIQIIGVTYCIYQIYTHSSDFDTFHLWSEFRIYFKTIIGVFGFLIFVSIIEFFLIEFGLINSRDVLIDPTIVNQIIGCIGAMCIWYVSTYWVHNVNSQETLTLTRSKSASASIGIGGTSSNNQLDVSIVQTIENGKGLFLFFG